jgi:hypothetical protein
MSKLGQPTWRRCALHCLTAHKHIAAKMTRYAGTLLDVAIFPRAFCLWSLVDEKNCKNSAVIKKQGLTTCSSQTSKWATPFHSHPHPSHHVLQEPCSPGGVSVTGAQAQAVRHKNRHTQEPFGELPVVKPGAGDEAKHSKRKCQGTRPHLGCRHGSSS